MQDARSASCCINEQSSLMLRPSQGLKDAGAPIVIPRPVNKITDSKRRHNQSNTTKIDDDC
eukprot:4509364-Amphidinium_carterae.2